MKRILVTDDTIDVFQNLHQLLTIIGHENLTAKNGPEAWDMLRTVTSYLATLGLRESIEARKKAITKDGDFAVNEKLGRTVRCKLCSYQQLIYR